MSKVCDTRTVAGFEIVLIQHGYDRFTVRYGLDTRTELTYAEATRAYGSVLMHALTLEEKIETR